MKPIIFNDAMVRAILDGRKTQTRRAVKPQHGADVVVTDGQVWRPSRTDYDGYASCPFGKPGDRLWVRETWIPGYYHDPDGEGGPMVSIIYAADNGDAMVKAPSYELAEDWSYSYSEDGDPPPARRSPVSMPRWASRITLEITDVRVQRLQDISEEDAIAEGVVCPRLGTYGMNPETVFRALWDSIAKPGALWRDNPWVWAISFKRVGA